MLASFFTFIVTNWSYILSGLFALIAICSIIVKLTPNTTDNSILDKIVSVLDKLSIAKTEKDKALIEFAKCMKEDTTN